ncbi:hypothetical protein mRhiFer1_008110 [Rhinolophus ferrumequinum]|uniref:Uncharacterized protein n=1 Tax=Rhinolophus ferrumequinum TaxID=59479 RepID=A0A7J7W7R1_RHIFE|nr:hypothetical protein mRhiFer1_008110 [Rhinolophus ferrumequinum]
MGSCSSTSLDWGRVWDSSEESRPLVFPIPTSTFHPLLPYCSPSPLSAQTGLTSGLIKGMKWIRQRNLDPAHDTGQEHRNSCQGRPGFTSPLPWAQQDTRSAEHSWCRAALGNELLEHMPQHPAYWSHWSHWFFLKTNDP